MSDPRRFSPWNLAVDEVIARAPDRGAVIQIKLAEGLLAYPRGRSAMVWYGAGPSCREAVARALRGLRGWAGGRQLLWRYRLSNEAPAICVKLLARFEGRFGAPPQGQKAGQTRDEGPSSST